uniref:CS domain-containing protein n=1 Tax=Hanusia phi TaxID=3032 RepID=A0A7S0HWJ0_9CRYP
MITPIFRVDQSATHVCIVMRTPYVKAEELEMDVSPFTAKLYVRPYFLSLTFKQPLRDDGTEKASWDVEKGEMSVSIAKLTPGEHFENLSSLTELLKKPTKKAGKELIQEVGGQAAGDGEEEDVDEVFEWEVDQNLPEEEPEDILRRSKYGFNDRHQGVFKDRQEFQSEVVDLIDPDAVPSSERTALRMKDEDEKFGDNFEHYLCDTFNNEENIRELLDFKCPWEDDNAEMKDERLQAGMETLSLRTTLKEVTEEYDIDFSKIEMSNSNMIGWQSDYTSEERDVLLKLSKREFLMSSQEKKRALIGLVDILFGFAYDHRTTLGEGTCESGWTVVKLSCTLCWLDTPRDVEASVCACMRRAISFPLYRHWELAQRVLQDVLHIIRKGRQSIVRSLIRVKHLLTQGERYLLNILYIDDYLVWLQSLSDKEFSNKTKILADHLAKAISSLHKSQCGWNLPLLEQEAKASIDRGEAAVSSSDFRESSAEPELTMSTSSSSSCSTSSSDGESEEEEESESSRNRPNLLEVPSNPRSALLLDGLSGAQGASAGTSQRPGRLIEELPETSPAAIDLRKFSSLPSVVSWCPIPRTMSSA